MGREKKVDYNRLVQLIADGHSTKQIASILDATEATVETWRARLMKSHNVKNSANLISHCYKTGILTI